MLQYAISRSMGPSSTNTIVIWWIVPGARRNIHVRVIQIAFRSLHISCSPRVAKMQAVLRVKSVKDKKHMNYFGIRE